DVVVLVDIHRARLAELLPAGDQGALLVEDLDPIILPVGDIDVAFRTSDVQVVRIAEVAWFRSHPAPRRDELPVARILHDARAPGLVTRVTVGDEDVAVGRNGYARRLVERIGSRSTNTR